MLDQASGEFDVITSSNIGPQSKPVEVILFLGLFFLA